MMAIISLLLLASLLPHLTYNARVNVGIVNGKEAKPHSRPYMVSVQEKEQHICGGFLISDRFVMTAAHCRNNAQVLTVLLGAHDLGKKNENSIRFRVDSYHQHPKYTTETYHNDILLLKLEKNVQLNNNIKWIPIPQKEGDIEAGSVCSVAGWGYLVTNKTSDLLMEINVKVLNNVECESKWGKKQFSASQMMCVHGDGGSCDGDSGGPLVCGDTAVGITSFGDPDQCNSQKLPEVYINISAYLPWIKNIIGNVN
ncbi:mast cell protease 4-like [Puntigrus tetrazona]|uniref:mast cell protease 4-like n=1 Tax=Puntigrus tetrazona TaxID=1606681 RepID=UPI001C8A9E44|nr:mast cell protease 4-like [Puntigrus tetrazona]